MDYDEFRELGFTDREIRVYLALIEIGTSTVGPISKKTRLQPAKVYETIERLKDKGLVSYIVISKTKHFKAADPGEILNLLDERKQKFKRIVEELRAKQKFAESKQTAIVHEGYKSFAALLNRIADMLDKGDYYYAFAFKQEYNDPVFSNLFRVFHEKLVAKGVDDRLIGHKQFRKPILKTFERNRQLKIRFTTSLWPTVIIMFRDRVVHLTWGERPTAVEVISEQIHKQYREFFLEVWKTAKA
jgi:sugar-specific transcriptional regulator TrmB